MCRGALPRDKLQVEGCIVGVVTISIGNGEIEVATVFLTDVLDGDVNFLPYTHILGGCKREGGLKRFDGMPDEGLRAVLGDDTLDVLYDMGGGNPFLFAINLANGENLVAAGGGELNVEMVIPIVAVGEPVAIYSGTSLEHPVLVVITQSEKIEFFLIIVVVVSSMDGASCDAVNGECQVKRGLFF